MKSFLNFIDNLMSEIEKSAEKGGVIVGKIDVDEDGNIRVSTSANKEVNNNEPQEANKGCNCENNTECQCKCGSKVCEKKEDSDRLIKFNENDVPSDEKVADYEAMYKCAWEENAKLRNDLDKKSDDYDNLLNNYKQLQGAYDALLTRTKGYEAAFMDIKTVLKKNNF